MKKITAGEIILGYEKTEKKEAHFFSRSWSGQITGTPKYGIPKLLSAIGKSLAYTSTRTYGLMLLVYGLISILIQFSKNTFGDPGEYVISTLVIGAVAALISTPFLAFDKPLCTGLQDFALSDYVLFDFFRIKRIYGESCVKTLHPVFAILIGTAAASLGIIVPTYIITAVIGAALYLYMSLISPEFSFYLALLMLPYIPLFDYSNLILAAIIGTTALSYFRKVISGKRVYNFEQYDILIVGFMISILITGIFFGGWKSFESALYVLVFALIYFIASNIITNRHLAECTFTAISLSSIPPAIIAIVEFIKAEAAGIREPFTLSSTFSSPSSLCAFLVTAIIASTVMLGYHGKSAVSVLFTFVFLLDIAVLGLSIRLDVIATLVIMLLLLFAIKKKANFAFLTIVIYILAHLIFVIPNNLIATVIDFLGGNPEIVSARRIALAEGLDTFLKSPVFGTGISTDGRGENLLLELALEAGASAILFFMLLMVVRLVHLWRYSRYLKESSLVISTVGSCGMVFAMLLLGIGDFIFKDPEIYALFFTVFGIGSATLRISKRVHDDRLGYFTDLDGVDRATADIDI